eukprot:8797804-Alexandrium_andersonii.AAC.1
MARMRVCVRAALHVLLLARRVLAPGRAGLRVRVCGVSRLFFRAARPPVSRSFFGCWLCLVAAAAGECAAVFGVVPPLLLAGSARVFCSLCGGGLPPLGWR